MEFIDIHSHYTWRVDDGIQNIDEALAALKAAKAQNINKIVATPHITPGTTTTQEFKKISQQINKLKTLANKIGIEIYDGCEVMLNSEYLTLLENNRYLTINNGPYLLVEFNVTQKLPEDYDERLYEYSLKNKLVIAHVERYFHHHLNENIIKEWIDLGYIIQINSSSILNRGRSHDFAFKLLELGLVHVIANDVHRSKGLRSPNLKETYDTLTKKFNSEDIIKLMYDNPLAIINGQPVELVKVRKVSKISWFKRRK